MKILNRLLLACMLPSTVLVLVGPPTYGSVLWLADHETRDISQWNDDAPWRSGPGLTSYRVTSEVAHSGRYSLASTIDTRVGGKAGIRWPVRHFADYPDNLPKTAYYSTWFYLPSAFSSTWWNFMQWKRAYVRPGRSQWSDPVASVNFEERPDTGAMYFSLNYKVGRDGGYKTDGWGTIATAEIDIPLRRWVHLECLYKWSTDKSGAISCWQDGELLWTFDNLITEFDYGSARLPRQFAVNAYGHDISPSPYTIYIDDVAISSTRLGGEGPAAQIFDVNVVPDNTAPGSIATIYGTGFSLEEGTVAAEMPLPRELGGVSVEFGPFKAPLFAVGPQQIVFQVPWELQGSPAGLDRVEGLVRAYDRKLSAPFELTVSLAAPHVFTMGEGEEHAQAVAVIGNTSIFAAPKGFWEGSRPARPGELVVAYATGLGAVDGAVVSGCNLCNYEEDDCMAGRSQDDSCVSILPAEVFLGSERGASVKVVWVGLDPFYVGVFRVYFEIPQNVQTGDEVPLWLVIGGVESQPGVTIAVEAD